MTGNTIARTLAALSAFAGLVLAPAIARAQQLDVNPPLPNVLLLIDNSGSMERMIDGTLPEANAATTCNCDPTTGACNWNAQPAPNRWGIMLQTMAGSFQNGYNCAAMPRTPGSVFASEYQINGVPPYDVNYYLPFHRPIGKDTQTSATPLSCVFAPGSLPGAAAGQGVGTAGVGAGGNATDFPSAAIVQRTYGANPKTCTFPQTADGVIDSERDIMRFGLMTFDQDPDPGTGATAGNQVANPAFTGNWSYFPGWSAGTGAQPPTTLFGAPAYWGKPVDCTTAPTLMAVGARNPAAPPWEGRMVPFPATTDLPAQETQNDDVQQVLVSSRPYGATPLAGMMLDARYYFQADPTGPQATDVYVQGGCRQQFIILLTDGAPNLDMQPQCSAATTNGNPGVCPFPLPQDTATALKVPAGSQPVTTFVIGFAVSSFVDQGQTIYCSSLVQNGTLAAVCADPTKQTLYGPCCTLQQIAISGGTTAAYFADTPGDLQNALGAILGQIASKQTTRTTPAYSPVVSNNIADPNNPLPAQSNASVYLASFTPSPGRPWSGDVQRQRFTCQTAGQGTGFTVQTQKIDPTQGDDFAADLNSNSSPRTFVMFQPAALPSGSGVDATTTIRPFVATTGGDGIGQYSATTFAGIATNVIPNITPPALGLTDTNCGAYNAKNGGGPQPPLTALQCRDMLLDFSLGVQSFSGPSNFPFVTRYGNALGDIYHAVPTVVGPPASLLRDDSYVAFRQANASRLQIVYAATNDGLLHAFKANETKLENNELWALMPPAVMPNLLSSYPSTDKFLLDGSPVTKDVVWDRLLSNQGLSTNWHSTLVAGFGPSWPGYYAIDVTSTANTGIPHTPPEPTPVGPVFLWQLTKMPSTNVQLFGAHSGTPAITTVVVDLSDGNGPHEVGVAILPGGQNSAPSTFGGGVAKCDRASPKPSDAAPPTGYAYRTSVRCWGTPPTGNAPSKTDPVIGRSVTIARLDTGEILRVFTRVADVPATDTLLLKGRVTDTLLDSPMTGTPVVYPSDIGTDATKAFVGDADGTIWRFDLSSTDPTKWVGELYLDLYNPTADLNPTATSWADGQPLQVPLVTSLDPAGNLVLNAATGSQDTFDTTGMYFVYSITELVQGTPAKLRASVNWWLNPTKVTSQAGERVSGPMTVFDGVLYFATYAAAPAATQACTSGHGRIWGLDFVTPADTAVPPDRSKGGLARLNPQPVLHPQYIQPDEADTTLQGIVIPGVSINATPACADSPTATSDPYVAGASHSSPANFTPGSYSVFAQLGTTGTNGAATRQFTQAVPTPLSPTTIDSWAAVLE
jgi:type IV pilus assembly protein PilY1